MLMLFVKKYHQELELLNKWGDLCVGRLRRKPTEAYLNLTSIIAVQFGTVSAVSRAVNYKKLRNRAARIIAECTYEISSSSLLEELNWYKLSLNRKKHKAILMYKTINKSVPQYLQDLFSLRSCPYSLKDNENKLFVPKPRTDYLKRSFSYERAVLWNSLPTQLRSAQSLSVFKRGLNNWLASTDSHTAIM